MIFKLGQTIYFRCRNYYLDNIYKLKIDKEDSAFCTLLTDNVSKRGGARHSLLEVKSAFEYGYWVEVVVNKNKRI